MKSASHLMFAVVAFAVAAPSVAAQQKGAAPRLPEIYFLSAGDEATIRLPGSVMKSAAVEGAPPLLLSIFGQTLAKLTPEGGMVQFRVPNVRAVTLLTVSTSQIPAVTVAEALVYPPGHRFHWDVRHRIHVAKPSPQWLVQWLDAVGIPYEAIDINQQQPTTSSNTLIVGKLSAGQSSRQFDQRFRKSGQNVLLVSAAWLRPTPNVEEEFETIVPACLTGPLEPLAAERWSHPVSFNSRQRPFPAIVNRRTWIAGNSTPLVEELQTDWKSGTVVASYVPWQQLLGRNELADHLFAALLRATCEYRQVPTEWRPLRLRYPAVDVHDGTLRPVLATAVDRLADKARATAVDVFDLREPDSRHLPFDTITRDIARRAAQSPLLVLGSDRNGRMKATITRIRKLSEKHHHQLTWIAANRLPPSTADQIRLMHELTRLRIQLGTLSTPGISK